MFSLYLCNNSDRTCLFRALTFAVSLGRCWKPRPPVSVFSTSLGTQRMLMQEDEVFNTSLGTQQMLMREKTFDPYIETSRLWFIYWGVIVLVLITRNVSNFILTWYKHMGQKIFLPPKCRVRNDNIKWASSWDYDIYHIDDQRRLRRACASAQSHQTLHWSYTWSREVDVGSDQKSDI